MSPFPFIHLLSPLFSSPTSTQINIGFVVLCYGGRGWGNFSLSVNIFLENFLCEKEETTCRILVREGLRKIKD